MGAVDAIEWSCVLCGCCIQNDGVSTATNLHQILCYAWTLPHGNYGKIFRWLIRPQLWATGDRQLYHDNVPTHASCVCRVFWPNIKSPRWLSPPTTQIWCPVTSLAFPKTKNHLWKERDFRLLMRFRNIRWGSWWWLGELGEVPRCPLWRGLRRHFPVYNVSCILYLLQ